jgi:hypothetical protein
MSEFLFIYLTSSFTFIFRLSTVNSFCFIVGKESAGGNAVMS